MIGKTITNSNGSQYIVLMARNDYTLLLCINSKTFVVAWKINYDDHCNWCQGYYFDSLIIAVEKMKTV